MRDPEERVVRARERRRATPCGAAREWPPPEASGDGPSGCGRGAAPQPERSGGHHGRFDSDEEPLLRDGTVHEEAEEARREGEEREAEFKDPKLPVLAVDRVYWGQPDAPITIVEYSDFECPYCARGYRTVKDLMVEYGDSVRLLYKHLPLEMHKEAFPAALYFEAIALQSEDTARRFHDALYENQAQLRGQGNAWMESVARSFGVDMERLQEDVQSEAVRSRVEADMEEAAAFGFTGTPGFLINDVSLKGAYPAAAFKEVIDRHLRNLPKDR